MRALVESPRRLLLPLLLMLSLSACGGGASSPGPGDEEPVATPKASLQPRNFAADCGDFLGYVAESLRNQYLNVYQCYADQPCPMLSVAGGPLVTDAPGSGSSSGGGGAAAPERVSQTNTQEAGVDEADIAKVDASDGRIYLLSGHRLLVVDAYPAEGLAERPLAELELQREGETFYPQGLYLDAAQDRLVVLGDAYDGSYRGEATAIRIDIADPSAPVELERLAVQGYSIDSRRVGQRVHRVVGYQPDLPAWFYDSSDALHGKRQRYLDARAAGRDGEAESLRTEIGSEIAARVRAAGAGPLLPRLRRTPAGVAPSERSLACAEIAHAEVSTGLGLALIDSFSLDGSTPRASSGLINNGYLVYGSADNLYLLQPSSGWFFAPAQIEETAIYRLALSATAAARFQGVGKVAGHVRDAYSLSEYQGYLRVASTQSQFGPDRVRSANRLTVLKADVAGDLPEVGLLADLAPGERIQGARLIGARGYLVTFRQIDPLFGLDLSDPTRPRVASELKLPGFSSHLQPLGEDYLLTVGRAGSDEGLNGQIGIQLFSVRELANIRQLAGITPQAGGSGYSYSVAEYDPHAFTYFADTEAAATPGRLVIPMQSWSEQSDEQFSGFLVVRVDPADSSPLRELGRISHGDFPGREEVCAGAASDSPAPCEQYYLRYAEPRRAVFQQGSSGSVLYTISSVGIIASAAAAPATEIARKELPYEPVCCYALPAD
ncbi:MAG: beta-propeller domain-containing protein [Stagnimonas sp.]|nr:beta-propeller domain-containing protein [Stagnimonas sp.]